MTVYDRATASALRMIKKYGAPVTWREPVSVPNPTQPWKPGAQPDIAHTPTVVFVPMNERQYRKAQLVAKSDVPTGYEMVYMAKVDFEPSINGVIVRSNGATYRVKAFDSIDVDGNGAILYEILVQK